MAWNWTAQSCCRAQWNEARQDIASHITLAHAKHTIVSVKSGVLCQPHGFSLHADVRCAMHQRSKLERLCRYITRPAIADERLARNQDGQVILTLKTPFRDGTTPSDVAAGIHATAGCAGFPGKAQPHSFPWRTCAECQASLRDLPGSKKNKNNPSDRNDDVPPSVASVRIRWARLLKRVFDIEHCPHCGGALKIIATILKKAAITKILDHLGLSSSAPPRSPAQVFDPFEPI
ncbi:transposase [Nitrosomonas communis]|uniref:Putative transposase n=1 Tax=Nitrosomonas communis TaxID=44574 RepID=A0A1I4VTI5_9PROT|nr:transposase [Nitrosomonas communis]SFN04493.1 Putative transposase [Nitrosomonas communis]